ncbi:MAG: hypothetical protein ABIQ44_02870 [Chloroflexia bacterium]
MEEWPRQIWICSKAAFSFVRQFRKRPPQVERRDGGQADGAGVLLHRFKDGLGGHGLASHMAAAIDGPEEVACRETSRLGPGLQVGDGKGRYRHRAHPPSLPLEVNDDEATVPQLAMLEGERGGQEI